ncbi:MAG: hypothetical protein KAQ72_17980 [Desulfobacula sp.]|nr:hypothetical protein [Desulfobacula sp.]
MEPITAQKVLKALNRITDNRIPAQDIPKKPGNHPFILEKNSGIPGKAILETPGLVVGNLDKPIATMGIGMTLTENMIELAGALDLDAILVHHPVADAASSGGVPLKPYLELYNLALFELHEAFHGLHPGIAFLHGHTVLDSDHCFGGIPGNIIFLGKALPEIHSAKDIIRRLNDFMAFEKEHEVLDAEIKIRACPSMKETTLTAVPKILNGAPDSPVENVLHIFPHTGFTARHLEQALDQYPETDTIITSISRVLETSDIVAKARSMGLTLIIGNSHAHEIFENGLPLACALRYELPHVELMMLRERVTAVPLKQFGNSKIQNYGQQMAKYLTNPLSNKKEI